MSDTSVMVQNRPYDHGDLTVKLDGKEQATTKELKWSGKREVGKLRGTHPVAIARGRGTADFEANMVLEKNEFDDMVERWGDGWMEREFDVGGTYGNDGQRLSTVLLRSCTITSYEEGTSEGSDLAMVTLGLDVMGIKINGKWAIKGQKF